MRGRRIQLLPSARVRNDILHFAHKVPTLPVQRRMALDSLVKARSACQKRPPWTALFLRAYALLAQEIPELRRVYIGLPRPHLYEYPTSVGMVAFERKTAEGAEIFAGRIKDPASRSLAELAEILRRFNEAPLGEIKDFRRALTVGRLPLRLRRLLIWIALNFGRERANFFGTFYLTVYSAFGAELAAATVSLYDRPQLRRDCRRRHGRRALELRPSRHGRCDHRSRPALARGHSDEENSRGADDDLALSNATRRRRSAPITSAAPPLRGRLFHWPNSGSVKAH